jgi:hypothetical protein
VRSKCENEEWGVRRVISGQVGKDVGVRVKVKVKE